METFSYFFSGAFPISAAGSILRFCGHSLTQLHSCFIALSPFLVLYVIGLVPLFIVVLSFDFLRALSSERHESLKTFFNVMSHQKLDTS